MPPNRYTITMLHVQVHVDIRHTFILNLFELIAMQMMVPVMFQVWLDEDEEIFWIGLNGFDIFDKIIMEIMMEVLKLKRNSIAYGLFGW